MEAVHRQARERERFTCTITWASVRSDSNRVTVRERKRDSETDIQTGRQEGERAKGRAHSYS